MARRAATLAIARGLGSPVQYSRDRGEARQFYWAINTLRDRHNTYWNDDGYLSRRERWDMRRRLEQLHSDMHDAHDNGHAERDYGCYDDRGYSNQGGYYGGDNRYDRR